MSLSRRFERLLKRPWIVLAAAAAVLAVVGGGAAVAVTQQDAPEEGLREAVAEATAAFAPPERFAGQPVIIDNVTIVRSWAFGTVAVPAPLSVHADPLAYLWVAFYQDDTWQVAVEGTDLYNRWVAQMPNNLLQPEQRSVVLGATQQGLDRGDPRQESFLSLPWATGDTWTLTGGPHHNAGCSASAGNCGPNSPRPWSALDFADTGEGAVRAAAEGVAWRFCPNFVRVDHSGGWQTGYYHLTNIPVSHGQSVARGQIVGYQSAKVGCGGHATGPHVHFSVRYKGAHQEIEGFPIGGWVPQDGTYQYTGCMERHADDYLRCQMGLIYNDGTIGLDNTVVVATPTPEPPENEYAPAGVNLLRNADFSTNDDWNIWGEMTIRNDGGTLVFYHNAQEQGGWASLRQDTDYAFPDDASVELTVMLGNTSSNAKTVNLVLHHPDNMSGYSNCVVTVPPNTPLQQYTMQAALQRSFSRLTFQMWIETPDGLPAITMDDTALVYLPEEAFTGTECITPGGDSDAPDRPGDGDDAGDEVVISPVVVVNPAPGAAVSSNPVDFIWERYPEASSYTLFVTAPNGVLFQFPVPTTQCNDRICGIRFNNAPLVDGVTHTWSVRAVLTDGSTRTSETVQFTVDLE